MDQRVTVLYILSMFFSAFLFALTCIFLLIGEGEIWIQLAYNAGARLSFFSSLILATIGFTIRIGQQALKSKEPNVY